LRETDRNEEGIVSHREGIHTRSIASCSAGVTWTAWGKSCSGWSNASLQVKRKFMLPCCLTVPSGG